MLKNVTIIFVFIMILTLISSCSQSEPSQLLFQGSEYILNGKKESSGGKFSILEYSNGKEKLFLILPHKETDLGEFSKIYTLTFKAQGFSFSSEGNKHIGISKSNIVYLTVSPKLKSLSILLVEKGNDNPKSLSAANRVFENLNELY